MLENTTATAADPLKRYAPPNQRNRSLNRRKSGDRFDRENSLGIDGEKNQGATSRTFTVMDHRDAKNSSETPHPELIALQGCAASEASQLLRDRWEAVMHCYNDRSIDLPERPIMYSGNGASACGHFRLPHQLMPPTIGVGPSGSHMDFLWELHRAMNNASSGYNM